MTVLRNRFFVNKTNRCTEFKIYDCTCSGKPFCPSSGVSEWKPTKLFLANKTNRCTEFKIYWYYDSTFFGKPFCPSSGVSEWKPAKLFLANETNRCTEFKIYWYYDSTCFGQLFCPSSGVLSHTSPLVHFMQLWWPFATRSRMELHGVPSYSW